MTAGGQMGRAGMLSVGWIWGRSFILDFADISRTFASETKMKEQSAARGKPSKFNERVRNSVSMLPQH
jgi:hypothetical protein